MRQSFHLLFYVVLSFVAWFISPEAVAQSGDSHTINYLRWKGTQHPLSEHEQRILEAADLQIEVSREQYNLRQDHARQRALQLRRSDERQGIPLTGYWTNSDNVRYWFFEHKFIAEKMVALKQAGPGRVRYLPMVIGAGEYSLDNQGQLTLVVEETARSYSLTIARLNDGTRSLRITDEHGTHLDLEAAPLPELGVAPHTNLRFVPDGVAAGISHAEVARFAVLRDR